MSREHLASLADETERQWRSPRPSSAGLRQIARGLLLATSDASSAAETLAAASEPLVWRSLEASDKTATAPNQLTNPVPTPWGEGSGVRGRLAASSPHLPGLATVSRTGASDMGRPPRPSPPAPLPRERGVPSEPLNDPVEAILQRSLLAARTTAWFAVHFVTLQSQAEDLVLAALLADAGCCRPRRKSQRDAVVQANDVEHVHVGAAFAAGFDDVPASLSLHIARHHERSDGTGFPERLKASRLTLGDRAIAAAVRFAELFDGSPLAAAKRLHHEARLGAFDAELTANLLWSLGGEFPADADFGRGAARTWMLTDHGRRRLRIDQAHPASKGPHFLKIPTRVSGTP